MDAYRRSGVDLGAAAEAVRLIGKIAQDASRPEVVASVGGFAGLFRIGDGRFLAAATDGVGTKLDVARRAARLDTIGIDLVAMCANDVLCTGAEPLFFLDYVATGRLEPAEVSAIVAGVAEGCRRAGCALLGGETAEHPGTVPPEHLDLAGFCVGVVEEAGLLGPDRVREDDALVGLRSSGLHANGYTLVRGAFAHLDPDAEPPGLGRPLVDELLEPTLIYAGPVLAAARAGLVSAAAHVTGGGILQNLPRALPGGLGARIDRATWDVPSVFRLLQRSADVSEEDLFGVVNMGIGMVLVVPAGREDPALATLGDAGAEPVTVGRVVAGEGVTLS